MLRLLAKRVVAEADYLLYNEGYQQESAKLEEQIARAKLELEQQRQTEDEYLAWLGRFEKYRDIEELSRDVIVNLIEKIEIYVEKRVHIKFLFRK